MSESRQGRKSEVIASRRPGQRNSTRPSCGDRSEWPSLRPACRSTVGGCAGGSLSARTGASLCPTPRGVGLVTGNGHEGRKFGAPEPASSANEPEKPSVLPDSGRRGAQRRSTLGGRVSQHRKPDSSAGTGGVPTREGFLSVSSVLSVVRSIQPQITRMKERASSLFRTDKRLCPLRAEWRSEGSSRFEAMWDENPAHRSEPRPRMNRKTRPFIRSSGSAVLVAVHPDRVGILVGLDGDKSLPDSARSGDRHEKWTTRDEDSAHRSQPRSRTNRKSRPFIRIRGAVALSAVHLVWWRSSPARTGQVAARLRAEWRSSREWTTRDENSAQRSQPRPRTNRKIRPFVRIRRCGRVGIAEGRTGISVQRTVRVIVVGKRPAPRDRECRTTIG